MSPSPTPIWSHEAYCISALNVETRGAARTRSHLLHTIETSRRMAERSLQLLEPILGCTAGTCFGGSSVDLMALTTLRTVRESLHGREANARGLPPFMRMTLTLHIWVQYEQ